MVFQYIEIERKKMRFTHAFVVFVCLFFFFFISSIVCFVFRSLSLKIAQVKKSIVQEGIKRVY